MRLPPHAQAGVVKIILALENLLSVNLKVSAPKIGIPYYYSSCVRAGQHIRQHRALKRNFHPPLGSLERFSEARYDFTNQKTARASRT